MKIVGLFAGIGGFELGLHAAGHQTELLCEILPIAQQVLSAHFKGVEIRNDVRAIKDLPRSTDVICAGFPCQDLSQAGQTRGLDGQNSGLVGEVFRLARLRRPKYIILENVPFMLQLRGGDAMRRIIDALEDMRGYRWAWRTVDTFAFGLPQRRQRVYLVASRAEDPSKLLFADETLVHRPPTAIGKSAHGFYWTEGRGGLGWAPNAIPTLKNGSTIGIPSPPAILLPSGKIIKPDIRDAERLQGFAPDWTKPAEALGTQRVRWNLVGNAVSVPVAEWLGYCLTRPRPYDKTRDRAFSVSGKLPKAARFDGKKRFAVDISTDPVAIKAPALATFLEHDGSELSLRATAGFLSRTRTAKLRFPEGFIAAVEQHLQRQADGPPCRQVA